MPNWCHLEITISVKGNEGLEDLDHLYTALQAGLARGEASLIASTLRMPEEIAATTSPAYPPHREEEIATCADAEKAEAMLAENEAFAARCAELRARYGSDNWYDWAICNWGVKWPDRVSSVQRKSRSIHLVSETPWSPPSQALLTISEQFPSWRITTRYYEGAMCFQGRHVVQGGVVLVEESSEYRGRRGG